MIDEELARRRTIQAIGEHPSFRVAREHGMHIVRQRDEVVEICLPMIPGMVRSIIRLPVHSRIVYADLNQAAAQGLVEAVDTFEPRKVVLHNKRPRPIKISTHAWWRVRKRVLEEVQESHWVSAKPPRSEIERFMKDEMSEAERQFYSNTVLAPVEEVAIEMDGYVDVRTQMGRAHAHALSGIQDR